MAASEQVEDAGNAEYHEDHMGAIFKEGFSFSGYERDLLVKNLGGGKFLNISGVSGVDSISDGRGAVFADFDNDGDTDIFLTTVQREAHYLFRNNVGSDKHHLRIELEGTTAGRDAFGTVVRVHGPGGVQTKLKAGGSGYISQNDPRLLFGLGDARQVDAVEVVWPGGQTQRVENVAADQTLRFVQGEDGFTTVAESRFSLVDPLSAEEALLAGLGLEQGAAFPNVTLRWPGGDEAGKLGDVLRPGRRSLINLWATWCVPCAKEMPELQRLYPGLKRAGIDLIGVSVDFDTVDRVAEYVRSRGVTYPIYTTDEAALDALYPRGEATVPLTVLLDQRGRVDRVYSGWSRRSEQALRELAE